MNDATHSDRLIIGGGSMGLAVADYLAAQRGGQSVRVLDAHSPPHDQGAHHGETRLIRLAYGEGAGYVGLAQRAYERWLELEHETGESLFLPTGVLNLGPASAPFIRQVEASANQFDLPLDVLDGEAVSRRWPGWNLAPDITGAFESRAGVLRVERILTRWRERVGRSRDVTLTTGARIVRLESREAGGYVAICADGRRFCTERVLIAAGQHLAPLVAPLGIELPLTRVRKTFAWFEADERYSVERFPGFSLTDLELGVYYGFPDIDGAGFKIGRHDSGQPLDPGEPMQAFGDHSDDLSELQQVVDRYLPGVGRLKHGAVCQYIRTPDEDFLIDEPLPGLIVAGGFSGHGFKFASAMGEALGRWLETGTSTSSLGAFARRRLARG
ncbi:N-methyl-L-tryptophan oxidase [Salinicola rhizosphaerae]|uniref:N-methyl-L-tryptophan oxidase n=1 Tax=Salinicola rhizosphaerae TaxID=1443141 RepID=A0ABQ3E6N2_9GAMM|nr:N-methyl-L-tryptophan oxidase [Salinicola rhizosphaerae]GHB21147.1 N-methyl-L-tryptophan oxidase [Salinicola rhizosphaerae]